MGKTIACDVQSRFDVSLFPRLLNGNTDIVEFKLGSDIGNGFVYDDRIVGKGFQKSYTSTSKSAARR